MRMLLLIMIGLPLAAAADPFEKLREEWAQDLQAKRVDAATTLYAPDAVFIQPDGTRVTGSTAIRDLYEQITSAFDSRLQFTSEHVEISGDLGYDSGTYAEKLRTRATGRSALMKGSYLTIYRRGKDGNWRIVEQMWTGPQTKAGQAEAPR
jgi:ketosteroid isomerase-like protein